jgi:hypothetical protein
MANGDIQVKVLYRQSLGGGKTLNGQSKNTKILVVGEITGSYVAAGLAVNKLGGPSAFGVTTLDVLELDVRSVAAVETTIEKLQLACYDVTNQKIFITEDIGAANPAVPSNADAIVIRFLAIGDDADAPELT